MSKGLGEPLERGRESFQISLSLRGIGNDSRPLFQSFILPRPDQSTHSPNDESKAPRNRQADERPTAARTEASGPSDCRLLRSYPSRHRKAAISSLSFA